MKEYRLTDWLPTTKKEVELRGWDELDVILFSGDAYVDHPSFGPAVICRILEALLFLNRIGVMTCAILRSWVALVFFLVSRQGVWIQW